MTIDFGIDELHDDAELEEVVGGMTCQAALALHSIYEITGDILNTLGSDRAHFYWGKADGVAQGGCDK